MKLRLPLMLSAILMASYSSFSISGAIDQHRAVDDGATETWGAALWSADSNPGTDTWTDGNTAILSVTPPGSGTPAGALLEVDTNISVGGVSLQQGILTVGGTSDMTINTGVAFNVADNSELWLKRLDFTSGASNGSTTIGTINVGDNGILKLGSPDKRIGASNSSGDQTGNYINFNATGSGNSKLYIWTHNGGSNYHAGVILLGGAAGFSDIYVDGVFNTRDYTDATGIGATANLHLAPGSIYVGRGEPGSSNRNVNNKLFIGDNVKFRVFSTIQVYVKNTIEAEDTNASFYTSDGGTITFQGDVNVGTGQFRVARSDGSGNTVSTANIESASFNAGSIDVKDKSRLFTRNNSNINLAGNFINSGGTANIETGSKVTSHSLQLNGGTTNISGQVVANSTRSQTRGESTLNINTGANVELYELTTFEGQSDATFNLNLTGGLLQINGTDNGTGSNNSILFGRYGGANTTLLNVSGGQFSAANTVMVMARSGNSVVTLTGGEMDLLGIRFNNYSGDYNSKNGTFHLGAEADGAGAGVLKIGAEGITYLRGPAQLYLGQGTIISKDNWSTSTNVGGTPTIIQLTHADEGTKFDTAGFTTTINHQLSGAGKIVLEDSTGTGKLALAVSSPDRTGSSVVKAGTLELVDAITAGNALSIYKGATVSGLSGGNVDYSVTAGKNLNIAGGATGTANLTGDLNMAGGSLTVDFGALGTPGSGTPLLAVTGNAAFTEDSVFALTGTYNRGDNLEGIYTLLSSAGISGYDAFPWQYQYPDPLFAEDYIYKITQSGNNLLLEIKVNARLIWNTGSDNWDTTSTIWRRGTASGVTYIDTYTAVFEDVATSPGTHTVTLTENLSPDMIEFGNVNDTYILVSNGSASLQGNGNMLKNGAGRTEINMTNASYSGSVDIQGGTLSVGAAGALGTGSVNVKGAVLELTGSGTLTNSRIVFNNGQLIYTGSNAFDISTIIDGANSAGDINVTVADAGNNVTWAGNYGGINANLVKNGPGALGITLTSAHTGTITHNDGLLNITLASGGILGADKLAGNGLVRITTTEVATQITGTSSTYTGRMELTSSAVYNVADLGVVNSAAHLYLNGSTLAGNGTLGSSLEIGSNGATIGSSTPSSSTVSGVVTGSGALTLASGNTLVFTNDTTALAGAITNNGNMTFGNGGAAALTSSERFVSSSSLTGSGVYAVNYANDTTLGATVGGTASLTQNGAGKLTLTADNTSTGTLTIADNTEVELQGSWAGGITGNGTLIANNSGTLDLSAITGGTTLNHVSAGTVALTSPTGYTGDINVTSGGALSLAGSGFGNKITVNNGSVTGGNLASNVHVQASGNVSLGGVSGSAINSLDTTASDITVSGINGNVSLTSSSVAIGVSNIAATTGTDPNTGQTGTAIIQFQDGSSTLALDALEVKIAQNTTLRDFLTASATRDKYAVMITNGTLSGNVASDPASAVTFDLILDQILGYRFEGVEGGNLIINGQPLNVPYTVFHDEHKRLDSPSSLDVYDYVYVEGILDIDLDNGETLVVKELTGNYTTATINTGVAGATVELNNDANTRGTNYLGNISGSADIVKTGQYGLTLGSTTSGEGGNVQTDGNLSVREGELTIVGNTAVGGQTGVTSGATLNLGGDLTTGSLDLVSGSGLNMSGGSIALTGTGSTLGDGSVVNGASSINLGANAGVDIGQNVDLGGAVIDMGTSGSLTTQSDVTLTGLSGSGALGTDGSAITLAGQTDSQFTGSLSGAGGTIVKQGQGMQTIASTSDNSSYDLNVREGNVVLKQNGTEVRWNNITVDNGAALSLGSHRPDLSAVPTTAYVNSASFANGSTLNTVIPSDNGALHASGTITLPHQMSVNLLNNGTFDFGNPVRELVVMKADGGYLWGDGAQAGQAISGNTLFDNWNVRIEKSIALFYGSADLYLANDGITVMANPVASNENALIGVAQSHNAMAGAYLLWDAGLQPTGSTLDNLLSCIMDRVQEGNTGAASRMMAASMGSTYVSMLSATQAGLKQQQTWIRNRMAGMGLSQGYNYANDVPLFNAWIQGTGSYNKLDNRGDEAGYELNTWGGTVGFDMNLTTRLTVGAAFTASFGDLKSHSADSLDGDLDMYYVNLFAQYKYKRWTHALILTGAWGEADVTRSVIYDCGMYRGTGKSDATSYGAMYEGTYDIYLNRNRTTILQPLVNASINHNKIDNFEEAGAGNAGLNVSDLDATTGTISAGARLMGLVGSNVFGREAVGEIRAQIVQDLGTTRSTAEMAYQGNPNVTQRVRGAKVGSTGIQFGAGLTVPVGEQGSVFTEGNVDLRSHGTSASGSIGYRYNF